VQQVTPLPVGGHSQESFVVAGVRLGSSAYVITGGFNRSSTYGGPIHEGLQVRIHYLPDLPGGGSQPTARNVILELEIASDP